MAAIHETGPAAGGDLLEDLVRCVTWRRGGPMTIWAPEPRGVAMDRAQQARWAGRLYLIVPSKATLAEVVEMWGGPAVAVGGAS